MPEIFKILLFNPYNRCNISFGVYLNHFYRFFEKFIFWAYPGLSLVTGAIWEKWKNEGMHFYNIFYEILK